MITKDQVREQLQRHQSMEFDGVVATYYLHIVQDVRTGQIRILRAEECRAGDDVLTVDVRIDRHLYADLLEGDDASIVDAIYTAEIAETHHFPEVVDDLYERAMALSQRDIDDAVYYMTVIVEDERPRSAWGRGVKRYAMELLREAQAGIYGGQVEMADLETAEALEKALLNGAADWRQYSEGSALIYNEDIAARLCTPSEYRRTKGGERRPNRRETWIDVQARALYQAWMLIRRAYKETVGA